MRSLIVLLILCAGHVLNAQPGLTIEMHINGMVASTAPGVVVVVSGASATVDFQYIVTNTGTDTLTNIAITDAQTGLVCTLPTLAPGNTANCSATAPAIIGQYTNTVQASAQPVDGNGDPSGPVITATNTGYYNGVYAQTSIELVQSAVCAGATATVRFTVRMLGGVPGVSLTSSELVHNLFASQSILFPGSPSFVGTDLNGNNNLDFVDNDGNGASDEVFIWQVNSAPITANLVFSAALNTPISLNGQSIGTAISIASGTIQWLPKPALAVNAVLPACPGTDGQLDLVVSNGSGYTCDWADLLGAPDPEDRTGLASGAYSVTVTNDNGCTATLTEQLNNNVSWTTTLTTLPVLCNGGNTGSVTATVIPSDTYAFIWSSNANTAELTGVGAGTYTVTITDPQGCINTATATVDQPAAITLQSSATLAQCGVANGTATVVATGGTAPYTYQWSNNQTTATATGLTGGITYQVTVTDSNGCTKHNNQLVGNVPINPTISSPSSICVGNSVTLTATGGTTFSWSNGASTAAITVAPSLTTTYTVTVTNSIGCSGTASRTITVNPLPVVSISGPTVICAGLASTFTATGGGTYLWSANAGSSTTPSVTVSNTGVYTVTVTTVNGCTATATRVLTVNPSPAATITGANVVCSGTATTFTAWGGVVYLWSNGATTASVSLVNSGTYTVTVTDPNGCTATVSRTLTVLPQSNVSITTTADVCVGGDIGTATATATGGTSPYTYLWSNGAVQNTVTDLAAGLYTVTATDANGCTQTATATVAQSDGPQPVTTVSPFDCVSGALGSVSTTVTGGLAPYNYLWSNGQTTSTAINLSTGIYTVVVTDANGCTKAATATVTVANPIVVTPSATHITCFGGNNGVVTTSVTGGSAPYTYIWSNGISNTPTLTGLSVGTYTVTVSGANGCSGVASVMVSQPPNLTVSVSASPAVCGLSNGNILMLVAGGLPPHTYVWSNGQTSGALMNLSAGTYTVTITDLNNCTVTGTAVVLQLGGPNINIASTPVSCFGGNNGSVTTTATGGASPYFYVWSNGASTANLVGVTAGAYTVTITDANGCTKTAAATVTQPSDITFAANVLPATCGFNNGAIDLTVTGGVPGYTYLWAPFAITTQDLNFIGPNLYTVTVTDANACSKTASYIVPQSSLPTVTITTTADECLGDTGTATAVVIGGVPPYDYLWSTGQNAASIANLPNGTYVVTVSDANGCVGTAVGTVALSDGPVIDFDMTPSLCGAATGTVSVTVTGGVGPYTYGWSNNQTSASLANLAAGLYTVTVTAANGCSATASITVGQTSPIQISPNTINILCFGQATGAISLSVTNGQPPYNYDWAHLPGTNNPANLTGLIAGTYTVTVTDNNGCTAASSAVIQQPTALTATSTIQQAICGLSNGAINLAVTGGTAPYAYVWTDGSTEEDRTGLSAGTYTVTVTDINGCTTTRTHFIVNTGIPSAFFNVLNVSCFGQSNGAIDLTVTGGTPPYTYDWLNLPGVNNPQDLSGLASGTYAVTVTDANGCTSTQIITVSQPPLLSLSFEACDQIQGVVAIGGTAPYSYLWSNGATVASGTFAPGQYTVTVTDNMGCTQTGTTIAVPNPDPCTQIDGFVRRDLNGNCTFDAGESGLGNIFMSATNGQHTYYGLSDAAGHYLIRVPPGSAYLVQGAKTLPPLATWCTPSAVTNPLAQGESLALDFLMDAPELCPELTVSMSTNLLRRCNNNNYLYVNWCNMSPFAATNAYVVLNLDDAMGYVGAAIPAIDLGSNTLRFNLGDLTPYECGSFWVKVSISCNAVLGQTHCSTATIYPNQPCDPLNEWNGAELRLRSVCDGDSLRFILKNIGTAPTTDAVEYIVIEDGILSMMPQGSPLAAGDSIIIPVPANGSTWRVEANQETTFPGTNRPNLSVEGCTATGTFSTGFVTQFLNGTQAPHEFTLCQQNVGSYDPNDKMGWPIGYGTPHYIEPGTPVQYRIRFQNTGTDTAFAVVIRDTLSPWLDMTSIRPGASSHPYHFEFVGENVIVFDFQGIMLPDSNVNAAASQGFVQFAITPKDTTPLETDIYNSAAIYFDNNAPVITNTAQHRIGLNFVAVDLWETPVPAYQIEVVPNPVVHRAHIRIKGASDGAFTLSVYDTRGRLHLSTRSSTPVFDLQRGQMPAGTYLFRIEQDGVWIGSGRMTVMD